MSIINVENLTFAYDGSADNIFENVSFHIDTDWKLSFTGRNGAGKSTLMHLITDNLSPDKDGGCVLWNGDLIVEQLSYETISLHSVSI